MIVLGLDPGLAITGIAIVEENRGKQNLTHSEAIITSQKLSTPERLSHLYDLLVLLIKSHRPYVAALETLIFNTNVTTAFAVGQARGVALLALSQASIPVFEYSNVQVKMSITGYGRADKNQIQQMVKTVLKIPQVLKPDDVADAAAIALTHCFSYKMKSSIK